MTLIEIEMGCTKIDRVLFLQFDCCLIYFYFIFLCQQKSPDYLCKLGGVIEFFLKEKDTAEGLLVLLFVLVISPEFRGWGKGEGGSKVFLEI